MNELISIIILNHNGVSYLKDCLDSVLLQSFSDFEIIFFDNNSNDESLNFIKSNYNDSRIKIIESKINLGFAGGNNEALKYTSGDLIVLLNNDTIVDKYWLEELHKVICSYSKIGIVQSFVKTEGIDEKYYKKNGTVNLFGNNIMNIFDISVDETGEILSATGCSMIIKRSVIDELGGYLFLNEYFTYAEDTFLSIRVKLLGMKIIHNSKSKVQHKGNATTGYFNRALLTFYQERNRLLNFLLLFSKSFRRKYYLLLILNFKLKFIYSLFKKEYSLRGLFRAYKWLLKNRKWIESKRNELARFKKADENDVLNMITSKIVNGENIFGRFLNIFPKLYCKVTGIQVLELKR